MRVSEIESAGRRQAPVPVGAEQVRQGEGRARVRVICESSKVH